MERKEFDLKYATLKILKSVQEYLKRKDAEDAAVFPIKVPSGLLAQLISLHGTEDADEVIHAIFRLGLSLWADKLYQEVFENTDSLQDFIRGLKEGEGEPSENRPS